MEASRRPTTAWTTRWRTCWPKRCEPARCGRGHRAIAGAARGALAAARDAAGGAGPGRRVDQARHLAADLARPALRRGNGGRLQELVPGCRPLPFGHLGDGNLHFNVTQPVGADKKAFLALWDDVNARRPRRDRALRRLHLGGTRHRPAQARVAAPREGPCRARSHAPASSRRSIRREFSTPARCCSRHPDSRARTPSARAARPLWSRVLAPCRLTRC